MKINGKDVSEYFARPVLQMILAQPFEAAERVGEFDVVATGRCVAAAFLDKPVLYATDYHHQIQRQASAWAPALTHFEPGLRPALKAGGCHPDT